MNARARCAIPAALVALVAAIYAPVRDHEYVDLDDMALIVWNPDMAPGSLGEALAIAFAKPQMSGWVPVATLSHQLDRRLWGQWNAGPALLENAALHALAAVLLWWGLWRLTGRLGASAFVAAVFAAHPLHVESVAWAIERKDVLSGVSFAALLALYARDVERPSQARHLALLACFAFGLLCKPTLVTAPFVLLLLDYWPLRRLDSAAVREKWAMFGMSALVALVTWRAQRSVDAFSFGSTLPLWARVANALDTLVAYLGDAFWPSGLTAYYPHPGVSLPGVRVLAAAALLCALSLGALALRRRMPWLLVGWLWYVGMLVPVIGLAQVGMQARADRYTYLPLIGVSIALAFSVDAIAALAPVASSQVHVPIPATSTSTCARCTRTRPIPSCAWAWSKRSTAGSNSLSPTSSGPTRSTPGWRGTPSTSSRVSPTTRPSRGTSTRRCGPRAARSHSPSRPVSATAPPCCASRSRCCRAGLPGRCLPVKGRLRTRDKR